MSKSRSSSELKGAILGTLLGDSYINLEKKSNSIGYRFGCEQIHKSLILYKKQILEEIFNKEISLLSRIRKPKVVHNNKKVSTFKPVFYIKKQSVYFKKLYKLLYNKNNEKQVTVNVLKYLTVEGLALWIMDDGYIGSYNKRDGIYNNSLYLCTDSFDEFSIKQICQYFSEKYNISAVIFKHQASKNAKQCYRIKFKAKDTQKIISLIYKYILPEFYYKITPKYKIDNSLDTNKLLPEFKIAYEYILKHTPSQIEKKDIV